MQFAESGVAEADGATFDDAGDDAADGVAFAFDLRDELVHALSGVGVGATHIVGVDGREVEFGVWPVERDVADRGSVGRDGDALSGESLFCDGAGYDACNCFASRRAAAAAVVAYAVLHRVGEVGMGRAEEVSDIVVVGRVLVGIFDDETDGLPGGATFENSGEKFDFIFFVASGNDSRLSGATAIEFELDFIDVDRQVCGNAVDDATDGSSVGFAERGEREDDSERVIAHCRW